MSVYWIESTWIHLLDGLFPQPVVSTNHWTFWAPKIKHPLDDVRNWFFSKTFSNCTEHDSSCIHKGLIFISLASFVKEEAGAFKLPKHIAISCSIAIHSIICMQLNYFVWILCLVQLDIIKSNINMCNSHKLQQA